MALTDLDLGTAPDNGTGDNLRLGGGKINANFAHLNSVKANDSEVVKQINKSDGTVLLKDANGLVTLPDFGAGGGAVIEDVIVNGETIKGASQNAIFDALALKVDKDGTKVLSDVNFSTAKDAKLASLESSKFKGTYISLAALQSAYPTTEEGSYAYVDGGVGSSVQTYIWDNDDSAWTLQGGGTTTETAASIKTKYESNLDTNAFTDAEKTNVANNTTHSARTDNPHAVTQTQVGLSNVNNTSDANKPVSNATQTALNAKANTTDLAAKVNKRTLKTITTTVSYILIAADFTDFILKFTANASEEIAVTLNAGVAPLNGELQMISTGNNKLVPSLGVGVTATYPEQTNPKTILKGWLGGIVTGTDTISFNGSLESTATGGGGIEEAPVDGTPYSRQDATWVAAATGGGATLTSQLTNDGDDTLNPFIDRTDVFTNSLAGTVPAPGVAGSTVYGGAITNPADGFTATIGDPVTVTASESAVVVGANRKKLTNEGWKPDGHPIKTITDVDIVSGNYTVTLDDSFYWLNIKTTVDTTIKIDFENLPIGFEVNGGINRSFSGGVSTATEVLFQPLLGGLIYHPDTYINGIQNRGSFKLKIDDNQAGFLSGELITAV